MDRREFLLNTAKASGVILPWCGVVAAHQHRQRAVSDRQAAGLLSTADGGWDSDSLTDPAIGVGLNNYTTAGPGDSPSWQDGHRADGKQRKQRAILAALQQSVDLRQRLQHADE